MTDEERPELTCEQQVMLQAVWELQGTDETRHPGTDQVDRRQFEIRQRAHQPAFRGLGSRPWHGTQVVARELEDRGLLEIHVGIAGFRAHGEDIPTAERYFLSLTDAGRAYASSDTTSGH